MILRLSASLGHFIETLIVYSNLSRLECSRKNVEKRGAIHPFTDTSDVYSRLYTQINRIGVRRTQPDKTF